MTDLSALALQITCNLLLIGELATWNEIFCDGNNHSDYNANFKQDKGIHNLSLNTPHLGVLAYKACQECFIGWCLGKIFREKRNHANYIVWEL